MFILRQTSVKMAVLLHKQAKVPFIMIIAVYHSRVHNWNNFIVRNQKAVRNISRFDAF